ncbi:MAG TPA: hypothetical protein PLT76_07805 [Candidatus Omnitrophota bacterium]|nr:hypothetical protein [Candidatus Omnitrophota bacterium]HPB67942.1 hypothetical protein [Candidatus Omnitrophota bacterium]HQO58610.1 hypothetical protein [Candidatus Omnitrophota bacterium]
MDAPLIISVALLVLVSGLLAASLKRIAQLKQALVKEKDRNKVPVLTFCLDMDEQDFKLVNDGTCTAKDIQIEDLPVTLDYQFKKTVRLAFEPIAVLHPTQAIPLKPSIHEGPYDITREVENGFFAHLKGCTFEARIQYSNFRNIRFREIIDGAVGCFKIREITPLEP